ncbi:hypothetical protein HDU96_002070 [Phlyctochytrium bullatum]|nr:hypothetical protein HDU96_002070 [Phlyctochytrium bullatum]
MPALLSSPPPPPSHSPSPPPAPSAGFHPHHQPIVSSDLTSQHGTVASAAAGGLSKIPTHHIQTSPANHQRRRNPFHFEHYFAIHRKLQLISAQRGQGAVVHPQASPEVTKPAPPRHIVVAPAMDFANDSVASGEVLDGPTGFARQATPTGSQATMVGPANAAAAVLMSPSALLKRTTSCSALSTYAAALAAAADEVIAPPVPSPSPSANVRQHPHERRVPTPSREVRAAAVGGMVGGCASPPPSPTLAGGAVRHHIRPHRASAPPLPSASALSTSPSSMLISPVPRKLLAPARFNLHPPASSNYQPMRRSYLLHPGAGSVTSAVARLEACVPAHMATGGIDVAVVHSVSQDSAATLHHGDNGIDPGFDGTGTSPSSMRGEYWNDFSSAVDEGDDDRFYHHHDHATHLRGHHELRPRVSAWGGAAASSLDAARAELFDIIHSPATSPGPNDDLTDLPFPPPPSFSVPWRR